MDKKIVMKLLAIATNFVWEMLVAILIGLFVGRLLDNWLGFDRLFVIVLMFLGVIAVFRNFMKRIIRLGEKYDER